MGPTVPDDFERMWADLAPVGRSAASGGYFRQPFTTAERELDAWFAEQAEARGLRVERDEIGNVVAWWDAGSGPGVLTGSHLDSVLDGGAYDGPLGVVSALAAVDALRERGVVPARPIGVATFVEEEGSRFGIACLGSRLATGATSWESARELRDRDGVAFGDVAAGGSSGLLADVATYVELHVEQGRDLVDRGAAVGVGSEIWPHGRYRLDFTGEANHAGTTRMEDRVDPMLTYAMTALAANKQARLAGQRATFGRVEVTPNGTNAVPSLVTAWLDARCATDSALADLVETISRQATERADRDGTSVTVTPESVSGSVAFDPALAATIAADHAGRRLADHPHGRRPRRRDPLCCRDPDRDAVRPQPHRRLALAGRARRDVRLPGRRLRARRHAREADPVTATAYVLERAWVDGAVQDDVLVEIEDGRFVGVETGGRSDAATRLPGLTLPGLANCHSHAFHRALRGRTQRGRGTFWTWREQMYAVAQRLDPDSYFALARATYREMAAGGITCVGEFHYLHHQPDGTPYDDPNAMGHAFIAAAEGGRDPDRAAGHLLPQQRLRGAGRIRATALLRRRCWGAGPPGPNNCAGTTTP